MSSVEENQKDAVLRRARGEFVRGVSRFRHQIGDSDAPAEPNRYHLFVALNCPWCHRVVLTRHLLGLQNTISMDVVFPSRTDDNDPAGPNLWEFNPSRIASVTQSPLPECTPDTGSGNNRRLVTEIYAQEHSGEKSVPILYDKKAKRIVNNESADIIRMLNAHATPLGSLINAGARPDLYPDNKEARSLIDEFNERIYHTINNGAYKAGFSSDQIVYAEAYRAYFDTLAWIENRLAADNRPFLTGEQFTEADLRLFPTLYRHDPIYYLRMKLNGAKVLDYPHLWRWLCRVYMLEGVADSCSMTHCLQGYFGRSWNNVIPLGPFTPMPYPDAYRHPELATSGTGQVRLVRHKT